MRTTTVMLVDDNNTDNFIAKSIIGISGFSNSIIVKTCGLEALDYLYSNVCIPENLPDFLFLDLNMPGMNGFFFLSKFERLPSIVKDKCKIVVLTSSTNESDKERVGKFGVVVDYVTKPLSLSFLNQLEKKFNLSPVREEKRSSVRL